MTKKILIAILILGIGYFGLNYLNNQESESTNLDQDFAANQVEEQIPLDLDVNEYRIAQESTVSYVVQKEFFNKPTEPVTGITSDVSGTLEFDSESGLVSVNAEIDPDTFDSGSNGRDNEVDELFDGNIFVSVENTIIENYDDLESETVLSFTSPVSITINGITNVETFDIGAQLNEGRLEFNGSTQTNMTDYQIEPPSAIGIYGVDEIVELSFDLVATK